MALRVGWIVEIPLIGLVGLPSVPSIGRCVSGRQVAKTDSSVVGNAADGSKSCSKSRTGRGRYTTEIDDDARGCVRNFRVDAVVRSFESLSEHILTFPLTESKCGFLIQLC